MDLYNITTPMIGIITAGTENFNLIKLCQKLNLSFCILADTEMRPYQDKTDCFIKKRTKTLLERSKELGCTHILINPTQELLLYHDNIDTHGQIIIPLFGSYFNYCLNKSLIGKIGFIGGYSDISQIESFFTIIKKDYQLSDKQKNTKQFKLSKRIKDTSMWEYFSRLYSSRDLLTNKTIKEDLKYFKDANIDTLIPLNYSYFNYQRTITSYLNPKKYKFHKRDRVEEIFRDIIKTKELKNLNSKILTIYHTGSLHLINYKKWEALVSQGGKKEITYKLLIL